MTSGCACISGTRNRACPSFDIKIKQLRIVANGNGWVVCEDSHTDRIKVEKDVAVKAPCPPEKLRLTAVKIAHGYIIDLAVAKRTPKTGVNALNIETGAVWELEECRMVEWDGRRVFPSNEIFKVLREYIRINPGERHWEQQPRIA